MTAVDPPVAGGQSPYTHVVGVNAMLFLVLGIILLGMKYMEFGPVAMWDWWVVLSPFGLAVAWWWWADWSGYTKKKAMEKEEGRRQARIDKSREKLGIKPRHRR